MFSSKVALVRDMLVPRRVLPLPPSSTTTLLRLLSNMWESDEHFEELYIEPHRQVPTFAWAVSMRH